MLANEEKKKIEKYIEKINIDILEEVRKSLQSRLPEKQVVDKIITITVNKFIPQSKMIMSSAYNMMMKETLAKPIFQIAQNKAAFYELNILKELNEKFNFDIPNKIDYEESKIEIGKLLTTGVVIVTGGIISISMNSWIPVGIAAIIAGAMFFLLKDSTMNEKQDVDYLIKEYLENVKKSLLQWIESIEKYYDKKIFDLERKLEE